MTRFPFTKLPVEDLDDVTLDLDQVADSALSVLRFGAGVPAVTLGVDGDFYLRTDGGAGTAIYQRRAGAWVATAA